MASSPQLSPAGIDDATRRQLFLDARSALDFADAPVDPAVIREAFDLVKWGPTGNNSVPMRLALATSEAARSTVIHAASLTNRPKLVKAPMIVVVARDERYHDHFHVTAPGAQDVADRLEAHPLDRAARAERGTWMQAAYLIVGLRAVGLAVRPYGGFDPTVVDDALFANRSWRSQLLLGVGWPNLDHGAGPRKGRIDSPDAVVEF